MQPKQFPLSSWMTLKGQAIHLIQAGETEKKTGRQKRSTQE